MSICSRLLAPAVTSRYPISGSERIEQCSGVLEPWTGGLHTTSPLPDQLFGVLERASSGRAALWGQPDSWAKAKHQKIKAAAAGLEPSDQNALTWGRGQQQVPALFAAQQLSMAQSATQAQTVSRRSEHTVATGSPTAAETALVPRLLCSFRDGCSGPSSFFFFGGGAESSVSGVLCQRQEEASTADLKRAPSLSSSAHTD